LVQKFNRKFGRNLNGISRLNNTPRIVLYGRLANLLFWTDRSDNYNGWFIYLVRTRFTNPGKLIAAQSNQSSGIYDRNGTLLYSVYQIKNRTYANLNLIPKYLQQGTISVEDRNFYTNSGFSITGYIRAAVDIVLLRGFPEVQP